MADVRLRAMTRGDLDAVNAIYNHYVLHSTCTYQLEPETAEARAAWFDEHGPAHPLLVAERGGTVVAWGSLSRYNARGGYARTVENSVYVAHDAQRQGIGSVILGELVARARTHGHHLIVAGIDAAQDGSVALHARFGFTHAGRLSEAGYKFDRWLDVVYMQRRP
ncbi:MAG TPA: GNAT family N-acetyltransferase [Candidatus Binatia bacterium]